MHKPTGSEDARPMAQATTMAVLVQPSASTVGEAVRLALEAAGLQSIVVPTVFDAVVEIERAAGAVRYLAASVDYFGPQEFRLLPLVRREWPETILIASHSPGFNYKGRLAELVGADVILGSLDDVSRFAAGLPKAATEAAFQPRDLKAIAEFPAGGNYGANTYDDITNFSGGRLESAMP